MSSHNRQIPFGQFNPLLNETIPGKSDLDLDGSNFLQSVRALIKDKHTKDVLKNRSEFIAQVYKVLGDEEFGGTLTDSFSDITGIRFGRIRVIAKPIDIMEHFPEPSDPDDINILSMYPQFEVPDIMSVPSVGDWIRVTWRNLDSFEGGVCLGLYSLEGDISGVGEVQGAWSARLAFLTNGSSSNLAIFDPKIDLTIGENLSRQSPDSDDALINAGIIALNAGLSIWENGFIDPPDPTGNDEARSFINLIIGTDAGLGWASHVPYNQDGDFEWCGAFAAYCWRVAGLDPELAKWYYSSTYRLNNYGRYLRSVGKEPAEILLKFKKPELPIQGRKYLRLNQNSKPKDVEAFGPRAGDILITGLPGGMRMEFPTENPGIAPDYGTHITVVERFDPVEAVFHTVEGNGTGTFPDGKRKTGVCRNKRPLGTRKNELYHARLLIRPSIEDLTQLSTGVRL